MLKKWPVLSVNVQLVDESFEEMLLKMQKEESFEEILLKMQKEESFEEMLL